MKNLFWLLLVAVLLSACGGSNRIGSSDTQQVSQTIIPSPSPTPDILRLRAVVRGRPETIMMDVRMRTNGGRNLSASRGTFSGSFVVITRVSLLDSNINGHILTVFTDLRASELQSGDKIYFTCNTDNLESGFRDCRLLNARIRE